MRLNTPEAVLRVNRRALVAALLALLLCLCAGLYMMTVMRKEEEQ